MSWPTPSVSSTRPTTPRKTRTNWLGSALEMDKLSPIPVPNVAMMRPRIKVKLITPSAAASPSASPRLAAGREPCSSCPAR